MWSQSVSAIFAKRNVLRTNVVVNNCIRDMKFSTSETFKGHCRSLALQPSRFQWHKCKDMFHYYLMVGLIPVGSIIFYTNVYIGPAQLTKIPDNYCPKHWEYHKHPITRFIARYVHHSPQQEYEKFMHFLDEEQQKVKLRALESAVLSKMAERLDYKAYYYRPVVTKYLRINKKTGEDMYNRIGNDYSE